MLLPCLGEFDVLNADLTDQFYTQCSEDFFLNKLLIVVASSLFLAACGGGGSDDAPSGPTQYIPVAQKAGDSYYYTRTNTLSNGTIQTFAEHIEVATVSSSGSRYINTYDGNSVSTSSLLYDANNYLIYDATRACGYKPAMYTINKSLFVGQSYAQTVKETCDITQTVNIDNQTRVESYETITVGTGTFNTLKIKNTKIFSDDRISLANVNSYTENSTCWVNVVTGQAVRCNVNRVFTNTITPTTVLSYTTELTSVKDATSDAFALTGSSASGEIPFLYLTPNHIDYFSRSGNQIYTFNTTEPVIWTIVVGGGPATAISNLQQTVTGSGLSVTASATSKSFNASINGSTLSSSVNWVLKAALVSEPTKFVILLIGYEPSKPFVPFQILPIKPIKPIKPITPIAITPIAITPSM